MKAGVAKREGGSAFRSPSSFILHPSSFLPSLPGFRFQLSGLKFQPSSSSPPSLPPHLEATILTYDMAPQIQSALEINEPRVVGLCQQLSVRELRLFGSAATGSYNPETSDVDIVVTFHDHDQPGIAERYMTLAEGLEDIFHRPVELLTDRSIRNPIFRRIIDQTSRQIYAA